ncbi:sporulation protein Cse60 [Clostridium sp. CTA-6]
MIQVQKFEGHNATEELNKWLKDKKEENILDIKYSVATFTESKSYDSEYFDCYAVIYKV